MVSVNRVSGRTVNNRMASVLENSRRKRDNNQDNRAVGNSRANDNRMKVNPVRDQRMDNNRESDSPDKRQAINLSPDNNRGSLNPVSVNRGNLKADNLSPVNNPAKAENRVSNLKTASLSRVDRNLGNAASEALRGCRTTTKREGLNSLKVARTAMPRRSLAKIS